MFPAGQRGAAVSLGGGDTLVPSRTSKPQENFYSIQFPASARDVVRYAPSLVLAEALGGSEGLLVRALRGGGAHDLREAIEGLPGLKKQELLSQVGEFRESLEAISRQKDSKKFYSELTTLAREMEREGKGAMAYRLYGLVAKQGSVSEKVRSQALGRMRVMEGKGDFFEQMGMFGEHFGEVIFDKPVLVGMGLTPIGSGLGRIRGLKWAKAWGQFGIRAKGLKHVAGFGGEVLAFTSGVSAVRMMLGEEVTATGYLRDLEGAVYLFGGMHVMKGLGFMGHGKIFSRNPQGYLANLTRPVVGQFGMGAGIGLGNYLQMKRKLIEDMGWEGLAGRSAAEWVQYNIAGLAARGTVGRIFRPWEKRLELELHGLEARLGKQPKGLGEYLGEMRGRGKVWGERAAATLDRAGEKLFPNAKTLRVLQGASANGLRENLFFNQGMGDRGRYSKISSSIPPNSGVRGSPEEGRRSDSRQTPQVVEDRGQGQERISSLPGEMAQVAEEMDRVRNRISSIPSMPAVRPRSSSVSVVPKEKKSGYSLHGEIAQDVVPLPKSASSTPPPGSSRSFHLVRKFEDLNSPISSILNPHGALRIVETMWENGGPINTHNLDKIHERLLDLPAGRYFLLHDGQGRTTYNFERKGSGVERDLRFWSRPMLRNPLEARDLPDLLRHLRFLEDTPPFGSTPLRVTVSGVWDPKLHGEFLEKALSNRPGLKIAAIDLLYFLRQQGQYIAAPREIFVRRLGGRWERALPEEHGP